MPSARRVLQMRSWTIVIAGGILATGFLPALPRPLYVLIPALLLLPMPWRGCRFFACLLLGSALAAVQGWRVQEARLPESCVRQRLALEGVVASLPRHTDTGDAGRRQRFELRVDAVSPARCAGPRRVLLSYFGDKILLPGQRWSFEVRLRRPWGLANPGSSNFQAWYLVSGIDALGSIVSRSARLLNAHAAVSQLPDRLRYRLSRQLERMGLRPQVSAVLRALVVADKSGIDYQLWGLFQQYGINHLLVISGLHVGMIATVGFLLGSLAGRCLQLLGCHYGHWGEATALVLAGGYAMLAGFSVATLRALVMLSCFMLARIVGRYSSAANNLRLAALAVLLLNPFAGLGSGFWLSFSAVAALLWLGQWLVPRGLFSRLAVAHLFMSLLMLPLGSFWFGGSSLVAAPANMLMVPLVGLYIVPLALLGVLCALWYEPLAEQCWLLAALPLEYLYQLSGQLPEPSWFHHLTPHWGTVLLGMTAMAILALPLVATRRIAALVLMLPLLLPQRTYDHGTRLTVLDVGQGTSVVFTSGRSALLYDTGGGNPGGADLAQTVVLPYLRTLGVRQLDALVISHGDLDHSAGLDTVLKAMPVAELWAGGTGEIHPRARDCRAGKAWQWPGPVTFRFLSPAGGVARSSNNASCVLSIVFDGHRLLLAGDIEALQERELIRYWQRELRSEVLLLGHHGSRSSTTQSWLNRVQPAVAVVSSGYANRFGHPHPQVITRLESQGVAVRETSREGALQFAFQPDGRALISGYREGFQPWWM